MPELETEDDPWSLDGDASDDTHACHDAVLPVEILERIVDYLSLNGSVADLRSCALTHRVLLPRARLYVFTTLTLRSQDAFANYLTTLRSGKLTGSSIASYVQRLRVRNVGRDAQKWWSWPVHIPMLLGPWLVNLAELCMSCPIMDPHPTFFVSVASYFTKVHTLELAGPVHLSVYNLIRMISAFPSLEALTVNLDGVRWPNLTPEDLLAMQPDPGMFLRLPQKLRQKLHLRSLSVASVDPQISYLIDWIIDGPSVTTLRTLWFEFWDEQVLGPVGQLVSACGASLEDLTLDSCCGPVSASALGNIDLKHNTNLRRLYLPHIDTSHVPTLITLLSSVTSKQLASVSLRLYATTRVGLKDNPDDHWIRLDALLAEASSFSSCLKEVEIYLEMKDKVFDPHAPTTFQRRLEKRLLKLRKRGVLKLDGRRPFRCMIKW
ncbi:hypothetical protein BXZ70DRAFT_224998 [Cristinia sonorae]|uniref:Uncharacterized protein n=1 Tax=Cristinia sonorae TaxID=1940300 RepID=A0A8K0XPR9_9AGAR|nr:hypothetical protein BXZ70DRAFT_224998 [Cristinia sonorae]